ncbi:unnamed protein product [Lampetra fluviatilis]
MRRSTAVAVHAHEPPVFEPQPIAAAGGCVRSRASRCLDPLWITGEGATVQLFTISEEPEEATPDVANPEKPRKKEKLKKALRDKKARAARIASDVPPPPRSLPLGPNGASPTSMEPAPEGSVWAAGAELGMCEVLTTVPLPPGVVAPPGAEGHISVRTRIFRYHDEADDASGARIATEIALPTPPYRSEQAYEVETRLIQDTTRTGARVTREITSESTPPPLPQRSC